MKIALLPLTLTLSLSQNAPAQTAPTRATPTLTSDACYNQYVKTSRRNLVGASITGLNTLGFAADTMKFIIHMLKEKKGVLGVDARAFGHVTGVSVASAAITAYLMHRTAYANLILTSVAEARAGRAGIYCEELADVINLAIYGHISPKALATGKWIYLTGKKQNDFRRALRWNLVTAEQIANVNRHLDATGQLCTAEAKKISGRAYVEAALVHIVK